MPLILPKRLFAQGQHPSELPIGRFYSYRDIAGENASLSDLVASFRDIPRADAIRWLCALSDVLYGEGAFNVNHQAALARKLLPPEWQAAIARLHQEDSNSNGAFFHRRALWLVLQLALIACSDGSGAMSPEEVAFRLARSCVMASDVLTQLDGDFYAALPDDVAEWMIAAIVPLLDCSVSRIDVELIGRARLLWVGIPETESYKTLARQKSLVDFKQAFETKHGISIKRFLRVLTFLYVSYLSHQLRRMSNPLLVEFSSDADTVIGRDDWIAALALLTQTPDELAIRLVKSRQAWPYDSTPLLDRPLLEVEPGKLCCFDLGLLTRGFVEKVYFLIREACDKDGFGNVIGALFECYVENAFQQFAVMEGHLRTYLREPSFCDGRGEAADGILCCANSAIIMEYKASLLTSRQRMANSPEEVLQGIGSIAAGTSSSKKKGVKQLASKIVHLLTTCSSVRVDGATFNLAGAQKLYPALVVFDERFAPHAVQKWLQRRFDAEIEKAGIETDRIGPLIVLTIRDVESLSQLGTSTSVESIVANYAHFLSSQPKDFIGTFQGFVKTHLAPSTHRSEGIVAQSHQDAIRELLPDGVEFEDAN